MECETGSKYQSISLSIDLQSELEFMVVFLFLLLLLHFGQLVSSTKFE